MTNKTARIGMSYFLITSAKEVASFATGKVSPWNFWLHRPVLSDGVCYSCGSLCSVDRLCVSACLCCRLPCRWHNTRWNYSKVRQLDHAGFERNCPGMPATARTQGHWEILLVWCFSRPSISLILLMPLFSGIKKRLFLLDHRLRSHLWLVVSSLVFPRRSGVYTHVDESFGHSSINTAVVCLSCHEEQRHSCCYYIFLRVRHYVSGLQGRPYLLSVHWAYFYPAVVGIRTHAMDFAFPGDNTTTPWAYLQ